MADDPDKAGIKAAILDRVKRNDHVTFVELGRNVQGFMATDAARYEYRMNAPLNHNVVLWAGMSKDGVEPLTELPNARAIRIVPTDPLVYAIDGGALQMPLVKSNRAYKKPYWLPVVLRPGGDPQEQGRG